MAAHCVREFDFDIRFASEAAAFENHNRIGSFVSVRLLEIADEVFSEFSPSDGSVVSIDRLDLDLGTLPGASWYEEGERRFRRKLEDAIRSKMLQIGGGAALSPDRRDSAVSSVRHEIEQLAGCLENGYLPWNSSRLTRKERNGGALVESMRRILSVEGVYFAERLRLVPDARAVAKRLVWQFPQDLIAVLIHALGSESPVAPSAHESTLLRLLLSQPADYALREILEYAVVHGEPARLLPVWEYVLRGETVLLEEIVRREGMRDEVRRAMARGLPDAILGGVAAVLEPGEIGFIEEITGRPEIFREAVRAQAVAAPPTWSEARVRLWEFTLAYLLLDRGSRFNRRAYVASVAERMAAHYNIAFHDLLASLIDVLNRFYVNSSLKEGMLSLLLDLVKPQAPAAPIPLSGREMWKSSLERALATGDFNQMASSRPATAEAAAEVWADMVASAPELVARVVREAGATEPLQHAVAAGFPLKVLREIVGALEPVNVAFIAQVVARPESFVVPDRSRPLTERVLWEFTLEHVISEHRSRFDRSEYVRKLIHWIAARDNVAPEIIATATAARARQAVLPDSLRSELLAVGGEAAPKTPSTPEPVEFPFAQVHDALTRGEFHLIGQLWPAWMSGRRASLEHAIRLAAANSDARHAMAHRLPAAVLRDIFEVLEPSEADFIEKVVSQSRVFEQTVEQRVAAPIVRRRLSEFTLDYVIVDRGSVFNRRSYVESLVRRMAAHDNVGYEELLTAIGDLLVRVRASGQISSELYATLSDLSDAVRSPLLAEQESEGSEDLIRSNELYERAAAALLFGKQPEDAGIIPLIEELRRDYPWLYRRIVRQLQSAPAGALPAWFTSAESSYLAALGIAPAIYLTTNGSSPDTTAPDTRAIDIAEIFRRSDSLTRIEIAGFVRTMGQLLEQPPARLIEQLRTALDDDMKLGFLCEVLTESQLSRILLLVTDAAWSRVPRIADLILDNRSIEEPGLKWRLVFKFIRHSEHVGSSGPSLEGEFIRSFVDALADARGIRDKAEFRRDIAQSLDRDEIPAGAIARRKISAVLRPSAPRSSRPAAVVRRESPRAVRLAPAPADDRQHIYIQNAGLILTSPFLPRLFAMAGLLKDNRFRDPDAAERGIHLLQYTVDETIYPPEHLLPLNKIICGLEPATPIRKEIELNAVERSAADGLLRAIIAHWQVLGHTSIQGLRETFLQREGRLQYTERGWRLLVQNGPFDMLLDRLPWSFHVTRHPWMDTTIYVEWR